LRALALILLLTACRDQPRPDPAPSTPPLDGSTASIPGWPELAGLALAEPIWVMDLGPRLDRPELAAHPPLTVGERIVIAGSRLGYLGLDRARGEIAWRRQAGPRLSAPLALAADDIILIRECDEAVGAPPGHAVLACFDRIDPQAIAGRAAGRLFLPDGDAGDCTAAGSGAWSLTGADPRALTIGRRLCRFSADLTSGRADRLPDDPGPGIPGDVHDVVLREPDGTPWHHDISTGAHRVVRTLRPGGTSLPGLLALAAARVPGRGDAGADVIRADTTLTRDYVAAYDASGIRWVWPLPAPPLADGGRGGPVGLSATERDVLVLFDGSRVARLSSSFSAPP
jgi:hypothetical protein